MSSTVPRPPTGIYLRIIAILRRHPQGITAGQIRKKLNIPPDEQVHLERRRRQLKTWYHVEKFVRKGQHYYRLGAKKRVALDDRNVSATLRAAVLHEAHGRCRMCGKSVDDGIKLVIDHKIPRDWGGKTERENLWALCTECNGGKKNFFASHDPKLMKKVMRHASVHVRLGELLKLHRKKPVPSSLMELAAGFGQEDWQKRARDLRYLGWDFKTHRERLPSGRVVSFYTLVKSAPWSDDPTRDAQRFERTRAARNRRRS